jgi:hypothetical protein
VRYLILVAAVVTLCSTRHATADEADDAWAALEKAQQFDLYSLDPDSGDNVKDGFHGWKSLGKTTVKDAQLRKKLITEVGDAIDNARASAKKCFDPRHAIRVTAGLKTYDFLICFECSYVYVYADSKRVAVWNTTDRSKEVLDKVLKDGKVPLPKSPHK